VKVTDEVSGENERDVAVAQQNLKPYQVAGTDPTRLRIAASCRWRR